MKTNKDLLSVITFIMLFTASFSQAQNTPTTKPPTVDISGYNFIIANDLGRNGYWDQKTVATAMGDWAEKADIEFVAAAGDIHHFNGVASVNDPLWMTNYELIYSNPSLMLDWYPICGNHEYRGNTQAVLDYSKISRRWVMPAKYYTMVKKVDKKTSIRLVFVDTTPMIDKYRKDSVTYPDAHKQNYIAQLQFIDSVLSASTETWKIVIGHHPIHTYTTKDESERKDMQQRLDPILRKNKVDFYVCGHIHNFQHIKQVDSPVDYIVNSSASGGRPVKNIEGTQFSSAKSGFALCSAVDNKLTISFLNTTGEPIYTFSKVK